MALPHIIVWSKNSKKGLVFVLDLRHMWRDFVKIRSTLWSASIWQKELPWNPTSINFQKIGTAYQGYSFLPESWSSGKCQYLEGNYDWRNPNFSVSHGWRVNNSFLMDGHGDFQPFCTWFWMLGRPAGLPFGAHFQRVYSPPSQSVAGIRVWIRKSRPGTLPETHQHSPWKIGHHPKKKHN